MNNCFILLLLLCCCGNNGRFGDSCPPERMPMCGRNNNDCGCGRDTRNDCGCGRDMRKNDSCMDRGVGSFPSPGSTCGCEEKDS